MLPKLLRKYPIATMRQNFRQPTKLGAETRGCSRRAREELLERAQKNNGTAKRCAFELQHWNRTKLHGFETQQNSLDRSNRPGDRSANHHSQKSSVDYTNIVSCLVIARNWQSCSIIAHKSSQCCILIALRLFYT